MVWTAVIDYELSAGFQAQLPFAFNPNERVGFFLESDPRPSEVYWRYSVVYRLVRSWGTTERPAFRNDRVWRQKWELRIPPPPPDGLGYNQTWLDVSVPPSSRLCAGTKLFVWRDV